jgi:hypothetical protein
MSLIDKASLIQIPSGYKSTKLYSIEPTNGDGDFTFARSSSATRVNSEGLIETAQVVSTTELVTNGDFATDTDWGKGTGWTISGGKASNDGTLGSHNLQQNSILVVGKKYQITFTVSDYVSGNVQVSAGASPRNSATSNGTYTFNQVSTPTSNFYIIANAFNGSIDNVSVKEVFENDVPRLDYSGGASCASLLLENQATNLVTYSEDFTNGWNLDGVTVLSNNSISPDGSLNADKITFVSGNERLYYIVSTSSAVFSVYLKGEEGKEVKIRNASGFIKTDIRLTENWERYEVFIDEANTNIQIQNINSEYVYVWGAQLEAGSYATSYIPSNSGSQTTRSADVCNNAGDANTFNDSEGVLFAEIAALADESTYKTITVNNNSQTNRVQISINSDEIYLAIVVGWVTQAFDSYTATNITSFNKVALKYKLNDVQLWLNGVQVLTDTSATMPIGLSKLKFDRGDGVDPFYGNTKQLIYFDEALSDEELSDLTGQVNLSFNNLATFYNYTIL